jgi:hypothetical protein
MNFVGWPSLMGSADMVASMKVVHASCNLVPVAGGVSAFWLVDNILYMQTLTTAL